MLETMHSRAQLPGSYLSTGQALACGPALGAGGALVESCGDNLPQRRRNVASQLVDCLGSFVDDGIDDGVTVIPSQRRLPSDRLIDENPQGLARFSHHLPAEARDRAVITALRLPAVLTVLFKYASLLKKWGARRPVPCPDSPLTHFASPRGEKSGLDIRAGIDRISHRLFRRQAGPSYTVSA